MTVSTETICAVATPTGRGGISIIRISGQESVKIAEQIIGFPPQPRHAHYGSFHSASGNIIDTGITLYFQVRIPLLEKMLWSFRPTAALM
jgi:tRNA modification GTPase